MGDLKQIDGVPVYCAYDAEVSVYELMKHPKNPNKHPNSQIELLAQIISEQGWRAPITVSNQSGYVVRGHGRLEAALYNGLKHVPVDYQDYADQGAELADMLADNRLAELSYRDDDLLKDALDALQEYDIDTILSGYEIDGEEFDDMNSGVEEKEDKPEVEFAEALREEHNYIVLYFDNEVDWLQAETLFELKQVKIPSTRKDGKITKGRARTGIGRVLNGARALERIRKAMVE